MIEDKILFVDDDPNILEAYRRMLSERLEVETAEGAVKGLDLIEKQGPYSVVISDLRMPGMDGIEFLAEVTEKSPDTVRMMLTGNADLDTAIQAVNEGNIFRFLTKPCPAGTMVNSLVAGINQYRLITAEKELLEKTLTGSIKLLTDILAIVAPEAFGRAVRFREAVRWIAQELQIENVWDVEMAWMFSHIGYITVPTEIADRQLTGQPLSEGETELVGEVPEMVRKLLQNIPRLESAARIVAYQNVHFDGSSMPKGVTLDEEIPLESGILKIVSDIARMESGKMPKEDILAALNEKAGWYHPAVFEAAIKVFTKPAPETAKFDVKVSELSPRDVLQSGIYTIDGKLLIAAGAEISHLHLQRIRNFARFVGIEEPIEVRRVVRTRKPLKLGS